MDTATYQRWLTDTRRFWDAGSAFEARYRRICSSPEFDAAADEFQLEALWDRETAAALPRILSGIPLSSDWTCLEIGCGIGRLIKPIAARCERVIGVDLSQRMVAWSRSYLAETANAEVILNNGRTLEGVADASIDFVYSHLAFQHITLFEVVESYLREIARVLRPGGYCRIQNWRDQPKPVIESIKDCVRPLLGRGRYRSSRCWQWREGRNVQFGGVTYHPRTWRKVLKRCGLRVVAIQVGEGHDYWMWTTSLPLRMRS